MQLGVFSISLNVKDIKASREFYVKFGFREFGGNIEQNWLIMKNGETVLGLFQGMMEKNTLTFNPGWDSNAQPVPGFTDIREIQRQLETQGVQLTARADEASTGPAYIIAIDPDGNPLLLDQHL
jgi:catechol 2,3-dioxygenase-like lactoylglutathione lyase family enzyme